MKKSAIIIGAGPAGLTAAYELLKNTDIKPILIEKDTCVGGISRTVNYKGNRIDIGGHRFFSKSDTVMNWWLDILPLQSSENNELNSKYHNKNENLIDNNSLLDPEKTDKIMLIRNRKSRIYYLRSFFDYPISFSWNTIKNIGLIRLIKIFIGYVSARLFPRKPEKHLEDFFINRFGTHLYKTFFKDYTEKVWGVSCRDISAVWGAQRIKGLSITKTIIHILKKMFSKKKKKEIDQKDTETSLIEFFMYPKFGPGQLWEEVLNQIIKMGGEIHFQHEVFQIDLNNKKTSKVISKNIKNGKKKEFSGDYFFSTLPVVDLIKSIKSDVPKDVKQIAEGLMYRSFITVGLLLKKLKITEKNGQNITDNWIYIQEPDVKVGRLQIFNNWSPYMVKNTENVWIGLEYFCNENPNDELWKLSDKQLIDLGISELDKISIIEKEQVLDHVVIRMPKTYPAYFGSYDKFDNIRNYVDQIENLFLIGRNGMHKYNNMDHSMLAAMEAVNHIIEKRTDKSKIWLVNSEQEYHETKEN